MNPPRSLYLFLTENCNMHCRHCYGSFSRQKRVDDLPLETWQGIIEQAIDAKVFYFALSGGEPTVYPWFPDLVDYLVERNQYFSLVTNGLWRPGVWESLKRAADHVIEVKFSLDGFDFPTYNRLRDIADPAIFSRVVAAIRATGAQGIPVSLGVNVHDEVAGRIVPFCDFIRDLHPRMVQISLISHAGRATEMAAEERMFPLADVRRIMAEFSRCLADVAVQFVDMPFSVDNGGKFGFSCPATLEFFAIDSAGFLLPCPLFNEPQLKKRIAFPSVRDVGLTAATGHDVFTELREAQRRPCLLDSRSCRNAEKCDRCLAQSLMEGDLFAPPAFCRQFADAIFPGGES